MAREQPDFWVGSQALYPLFSTLTVLQCATMRRKELFAKRVAGKWGLVNMDDLERPKDDFLRLRAVVASIVSAKDEKDMKVAHMFAQDTLGEVLGWRL